METYKSDLIDELFDSIDQIEQAKVDARMLLAAKIADAMKAKGWKNKDLLKAVGKENPSVISKWLSGTHNFTTDTLVELEHALDISLLDVHEKKEEVVVKYHVVVSQEVQVNPDPSYFNEVMNSSKQSKPSLSYGYSTRINPNTLMGEA